MNDQIRDPNNPTSAVLRDILAIISRSQFSGEEAERVFAAKQFVAKLLAKVEAEDDN